MTYNEIYNIAKQEEGGRRVTPEETSIGRRIFDLRIEHDVNQGELANAIHLHQSVLNRIEKGTRPARDKEIRDLANFFDVTADFLLGMDSPPKGQAFQGSSYTLLLSSPDEIEHIRKYRALDERGKRSVDETLAREYEYTRPQSEQLQEA